MRNIYAQKYIDARKTSESASREARAADDKSSEARQAWFNVRDTFRKTITDDQLMEMAIQMLQAELRESLEVPDASA